jgi:hypothetical protein
MRRFHQGLAKSDAFGKAARPDEDLWVGHNPHQPAQDLTRDAIAGVTVDDGVQPLSAQSVVIGVGPKCLDEDVDVGKNQRLDIRSSRSLELFKSIPGKVPPDAFETGSRKRAADEGRGSARTVFSPSSMSEVNVLPFSAACFFALRNRSSESRIVVRICQSILVRHIYVKHCSGCFTDTWIYQDGRCVASHISLIKR